MKKTQKAPQKKLKSSDFRMAFEENKMHLNVARTIERLRLKSGLTQKELAEKAGVSQPMIARMEKGDPTRTPTLSTISTILGALGYKLDIIIKKAA